MSNEDYTRNGKPKDPDPGLEEHIATAEPERGISAEELAAANEALSIIEGLKAELLRMRRVASTIGEANALDCLIEISQLRIEPPEEWPAEYSEIAREVFGTAISYLFGRFAELSRRDREGAEKGRSRLIVPMLHPGELPSER